MGAELARKQAGKRTRTEMTQSMLEEMATKPIKRKRNKKRR